MKHIQQPPKNQTLIITTTDNQTLTFPNLSTFDYSIYNYDNYTALVINNKHYQILTYKIYQ